MPLDFLSPERLFILLLIPLLIIGYIFASRRKNRRGMRFTNTSMLEVVVPKQSQWRRHVAVALSILSLVTLTAAFARPKTQVDVPRERATIVVVLDASLSMQAKDVDPNRLDAAKTAAKDFVLSLPEKYNVALVSMAGNAQILVPPTLDHRAVERAIDTIELQESTAIGEGIATAMRALKQAPKDKKNPDAVAPGAIVLLSDGESTAGRAPMQAAAEAGKQKVPIYTIAYGTENGYVDLDGKRELVPVNHEQMRQIAQTSGGEYFKAATADDLKKVYENIGSEVGYEKADKEVTSRFAGYGLAFAVLAALGAISLGSEVAVMTSVMSLNVVGLVPQLIPSFLAPGRLWLLLLIPALVALYLGLSRRKQNRQRQAGQTMLDLVIPRESTWKRHLAVGLSILSLLTLTLAFAKPKDTVMVPRERATVVVTIDVSLSMQAKDVEPDRLSAAKAAGVEFVNSLPEKFNVSVVAFAGTATTLVPPTLDRGAATAAIENLQLQPATAIGEGIYTSLAALAQVPTDPKNPGEKVPARIVLLSDGKTQTGRPADEAAKAARDQDVPVYTIAYGTENGYIEVNGRREPVPVDHAELKRVSQISGGEAYAAASAGELKDVYKDIGSSVGKEKVDKEVTSRYAGFGLAFAILAAVGMISLGARWP